MKRQKHTCNENRTTRSTLPKIGYIKIYRKQEIEQESKRKPEGQNPSKVTEELRSSSPGKALVASNKERCPSWPVGALVPRPDGHCLDILFLLIRARENDNLVDFYP